jgi:hypothetical protein
MIDVPRELAESQELIVVHLSGVTPRIPNAVQVSIKMPHLDREILFAAFTVIEQLSLQRGHVFLDVGETVQEQCPFNRIFLFVDHREIARLKIE